MIILISRVPAKLATYKASIRALLAGHDVKHCVKVETAPADPERRARGQKTGWILQESAWLEVDGRALATDRPTVDEIREILKR